MRYLLRMVDKTNAEDVVNHQHWLDYMCMWETLDYQYHDNEVLPFIRWVRSKVLKND